jgi:hypothetical protein
LGETHYIPKARLLSISRFNRQLHQYAECFDFYLETLMELARSGDAFVIDSMPVPVCRRGVYRKSVGRQ